MKRRVFSIKYVKHGARVDLRLLGRNDRGQSSVISHQSAIVAGRGKNTAIEMLEKLLTDVKEA